MSAVFADQFEVPAAAMRALVNELAWFSAVLERRLEAGFAGTADFSVDHLPPPELVADSPLASEIEELALNASERLVLALAIAPYIKPQLLDPFLLKNSAIDRSFSDFGGHALSTRTAFIPTGESAVFVLGGFDVAQRLEALKMLQPGARLFASGLLTIDEVTPHEPALAGVLKPQPGLISRLLGASDIAPEFGSTFPATELVTDLDWDDLVLEDRTMRKLDEIVTWTEHEGRIRDDWGLGRRLKPGFRALLFGPPGTGKTLSVALIGKRIGRPVYRIDLSTIVSKYIGETEKNLARLFDLANRRDWILFFDEADALFGKRTQTSSANDRYANQEVSYLLQRIEDYPSVVFLATNFKGNMDEAFLRRFQAEVRFESPGVRERLQIWKSVVTPNTPLDPAVDFQRLAETYELTGGAIVNAVRSAAIVAASKADAAITQADFVSGILRELQKEGRTP